MTKVQRNLDGAYFRVKRDGKWQNICFSDLTGDEMREVIKDKEISWLQSMCVILGSTLYSLGEAYNIVYKE